MLRALSRLIGDLLRPASRRSGTRPTSRTTRSTPAARGQYPGDFVGMPPISYEPRDDAVADPGEVVWTWVPYEEDHSRGKDRPVLIIGRDGPWLLALQLTSKDHDRDARQEASVGRFWYDIGPGDWDTTGRPSEARVNRVIRVDPDAVRRTGGRLDRRRFSAVVEQVASHLG